MAPNLQVTLPTFSGEQPDYRAWFLKLRAAVAGTAYAAVVLKFNCSKFDSSQRFTLPASIVSFAKCNH